MNSGQPLRVRGRAAFRALSRTSCRARSGPVAVHFVPEDTDTPSVRVAYAVGRRVGGAVVRNRCRRRLRAIAAEIAPELPPGAYLVRAEPAAIALDFDELRERVTQSMRNASRERR